MSGSIHFIRHRAGALRLRYQHRRLQQLQQLLDEHSFWARGRSIGELKKVLADSQAVVSAWKDDTMVGFGRANSDGVFRAVLWDVVVTAEFQGQGLGRRVVNTLLSAPKVKGVERVYIMTTNSTGFYKQLGFEAVSSQQLMVRFSQEQATNR